MNLFKKIFKRLKVIIKTFYFQNIELYKYPKIKEIKCSEIQKDLIGERLLIVLRGETYRNNNRCDETSRKTKLSSQEFCIKQFVKHVLLVIQKEHPNTHICVKIITYPHPKNFKLLDIISNYSDCELIELEKDKNNQVSTFLHSIKTAKEENFSGLLAIRIDIAFISDLITKNFCQNKVLFQWNLLHNKKTLEVPDQIHFIGANLFEKIYNASFSNKKDLLVLRGDDNTLELTPTCLLDNRWEGTLHNFLRFCLKTIKIEQIGYLNYIVDPDVKKIDCDVRGHPNSRKGNPLYKF